MDGEPLQAKQGCGGAVDGNQLAAASWYYPCGTQLRVWSLRTGRSVVVTVTDQGPHLMMYPKHIVDLSPAARDALGHESGGPIALMPWGFSGSTRVAQADQ